MWDNGIIDVVRTELGYVGLAVSVRGGVCDSVVEGGAEGVGV